MINTTDLQNEISAASKQIQQKQKTASPEQQLKHTLDLMMPEIQRALPKHMDADRIARIALTAVRNTPKLLETDSTSFLAALMQSSQLGLEPNTPLGQAYLIPYGKQTQFQIGYQGMLELAYRTHEYKVIYAKEVYANDEFSYELGLNPDLKHIPAQNPMGEPIGYYAVYNLINGGFMFEYWTKEKVELHASKFSKSRNNGPWKTNFDEMAKKTVLKSLLKYAPKSIEFSESISADETVKEEISNDMVHVRDVTEAPEQIETKE